MGEKIEWSSLAEGFGGLAAAQKLKPRSRGLSL